MFLIQFRSCNDISRFLSCDNWRLTFLNPCRHILDVRFKFFSFVSGRNLLAFVFTQFWHFLPHLVQFFQPRLNFGLGLGLFRHQVCASLKKRYFTSWKGMERWAIFSTSFSWQDLSKEVLKCSILLDLQKAYLSTSMTHTSLIWSRLSLLAASSASNAWWRWYFPRMLLRSVISSEAAWCFSNSQSYILGAKQKNKNSMNDQSSK